MSAFHTNRSVVGAISEFVSGFLRLDFFRLLIEVICEAQKVFSNVFDAGFRCELATLARTASEALGIF